jgi:hypothetical protein
MLNVGIEEEVDKSVLEQRYEQNFKPILDTLIDLVDKFVKNVNAYSSKTDENIKPLFYKALTRHICDEYNFCNVLLNNVDMFNDVDFLDDNKKKKRFSFLPKKWRKRSDILYKKACKAVYFVDMTKKLLKKFEETSFFAKTRANFCRLYFEKLQRILENFYGKASDAINETLWIKKGKR